MAFALNQLRDKALDALEEAAELSDKRPIVRKALRFALAYLWATSGAERGPEPERAGELERDLQGFGGAAGLAGQASWGAKPARP
jgi:hypothetical protein